MPEYTEVRDSGCREAFMTGAVRDTAEEKGRFDLLPPYALFRVARHFENGARKYDARNWEKGIHLARYLDSAYRHLLKLLDGSEDEDHASAAIWNLMCFIHTEEAIRQGKLPAELDNLVRKKILSDSLTSAPPSAKIDSSPTTKNEKNEREEEKSDGIGEVRRHPQEDDKGPHRYVTWSPDPPPWIKVPPKHT